MTTPVLETVRSIPLIVEKELPMAVDDGDDDSGFPFDRDFDREDRDDHLRSQLDDLAKRHPEFAEHLDGFPFRSDSLGRRSRPPRPSDESEFRRFAGRPFGSSRFERFGFPFSRDPFEDDYQRAEEPPKEQPQQTEEKPTRTPERGRRQNIQQSNTVDLGQKLEPVNDRNQRSMSAPPPDNRAGQQRFVSSINIPINRDGGMADMGTQQSQPQPSKPTERVIPIHVEGRDEPVVPKHTGPSFSQAQPERIFGQRPSQFTQYVGREPPKTYSAGPEWHHPGFAGNEPMRHQQQQQSPQPQQQHQQKHQQQPQEQFSPHQQTHQRQHQEQFSPQRPQEQEPQPQPQSQPEHPPQPPQPKPSPNPIDMIQLIQKDVSELMGQVEKFSGMPRDKQYLYLDEMLTRNLIKLDNIDTQGQENIRQARKEAIKCIESCIGILDAKAAANVPKESQPQEEEVKPEEPQPTTEEKPPTAEEKPATAEEKPATAEEKPATAEEKMEVEVKEPEKSEIQTQEQPSQEEKMEVVAEPITTAVLVIEPPKENPENVEQKSEESNQNDVKNDVEMNPVPVETAKPADAAPAPVSTEEASQEESKEDTSTEDKKEKKKGKKKVVKK